MRLFEVVKQPMSYPSGGEVRRGSQVGFQGKEWEVDRVGKDAILLSGFDRDGTRRTLPVHPAARLKVYVY